MKAARSKRCLRVKLTGSGSRPVAMKMARALNLVHPAYSFHVVSEGAYVSDLTGRRTRDYAVCARRRAKFSKLAKAKKWLTKNHMERLIPGVFFS
jgi:hypothetical protein